MTWNKVKKADGHQIYEYKKSSKKFEKAADTGSKTKSWKSRKIKKYIPIKYVLIEKQVNAGRLWFKEDVLDMSIHQCLTPTLKVKATRYAANDKAEIYDSTIRWSSSDETIAKVDKNGAIMTQGKEGNCKIYARAHNGNVTWIKVYAEDYATNVKFENVPAMVDDMQNLINNYQTEIEQIAAYFEKNKSEHPNKTQQMIFTLNDERKDVIGTITGRKGIEYKDIENVMLTVLQSFAGDMEIIVMDDVVRFKLRGYSSNFVLYF